MTPNTLTKFKWPQPFFMITAILFLKLMLLRYFLFGEIAWGRLISDAASLVFIVCMFELITPDRWKKYIFWTLNAVVSLLFFSSALYFQYFGTVPTYTAFHELDQVMGVKDSVQATIEIMNYTFFTDFVLAAIGWIVLRIAGIRLPSRRSAGRVWNLGIAAVAFMGLALSTMYIRDAKSIENELAQAEDVGFFNFQVSAALKPKQEKIADLSQVGKEITQLQSAAPDIETSEKSAAAFGKMKGKNLIIIQLEAFQNFPIHLKLNGQVLTPVLNGLADNGYYFPHFFQQIGQGNTSDAEYMSNTSIYPTAKVAMSTGYSDRATPSLPRLLEKRGYGTATFHVNNITFWDRDKMYPSLGFQKWYDKPSFRNDHFNGFGASDEELYRVGVSRMIELKKAKKPFYFQFVTASSHHPFKIPQNKQWLKLPGSIEGTQLGDYLQAVHYTDYAIGKLIEQLKANGLYDNTMIVIYGDHFGLQPKDNKPEDVSQKLGITYQERISRFNIPLIMQVPGKAPHKVVKTAGGQVDIMPTVANLLGVSLKDENYSAFGHDLLNTERNVFGMRYYLPTGSFFNNDVMYVPGKGFEDGTAISLDTLKPVSDFSKYKADYDYVLKLMGLSDQFVQSLPARK